jgi:hypothetical protein
MANYTITLTPAVNRNDPKDWGAEGAMDTSLSSGKSTQRNGYIQTSSSSHAASICLCADQAVNTDWVYSFVATADVDTTQQTINGAAGTRYAYPGLNIA